MQFSQEQRRLLWLSAAELSADRVNRLLEERGSAQVLWEDYQRGLSLTASPEANRVLARYHSELALDALCERIEKKGITVLFPGDEAYPALLSVIKDPPYALYVLGSVRALQMPSVAIVGTRYPSGYGRNMAQTLAFGLCDAGLGVVSGMARGIDGCAHEGAIAAGGPTVAVLGSGLNVPYPMDNIGIYRKLIEGMGAVISEYPIDATPQTYHFPNRNRVISGLCRGVVFVEGKIKSGGMITVNAALDQGRDVFAVPGCVGQQGSEGPHQIIREGATLITSAADILLDLGVSPKPDLTETRRELAPDGENQSQKSILKALLREPMGTDKLCAETGMSADALLAEVSVMEILGQIRRDPGNIFSLAIRMSRTE